MAIAKSYCFYILIIKTNALLKLTRYVSQFMTGQKRSKLRVDLSASLLSLSLINTKQYHY
ncbi:hypothetical protein CW735_00235 [Alteromonas sp. MB-3u-76]|nr:hypothetical protein BM528_00245 [Alteromonas sp. RW2A1]AUC86804.1 hypothetical protein CW735_00235 [Alteromonas sp. MB-3u-76]